MIFLNFYCINYALIHNSRSFIQQNKNEILYLGELSLKKKNYIR